MATTAKENNVNVNDPQSIQELSLYLQGMLQQMQDNFQKMTDKITIRIDDMGHKIDEIERSVADLMTQAGVDSH